MNSSTFNCQSCRKANPNKRNHVNRYCDNKCQHDYQTRIINEAVERGAAANSNQVKKYLVAKNGSVCSRCGITEWNGSPITKELEHKDGNAANNALANCCLLCPNCHSQTPTYKAKNMGNGRKSRGLLK